MAKFFAVYFFVNILRPRCRKTAKTLEIGLKIII